MIPRGRFAPSPTGPLHFGSLAAAVGSYLDARAHGGEWLVRIEDVDIPRTRPGAADAILRSLEAHGFEWSGPVLRQTTRFDAYVSALESLRRAGRAFPCACTRREIGEARYPGTCRAGLSAGKEPRAWRFRTGTEPVRFTDRLLGPFEEILEETHGDFVLLRADGYWAYQLAVVADDEFQGITDVVRGADLLDSTARQVALQQALGYRRPRYLHLPLVLSPSGEKLSKQTLAPPLDDGRAAESLSAALRFLGHPPPAGLGVADLWQWALPNWSLDRVQRAGVSASDPSETSSHDRTPL